MIDRIKGLLEDNEEKTRDKGEIIAELVAEQTRILQGMEETRAALAATEEMAQQIVARADAMKAAFRNMLGDHPERMGLEFNSFEEVCRDHALALENLREATAKSLKADEALLETIWEELERLRKTFS